MVRKMKSTVVQSFPQGGGSSGNYDTVLKLLTFLNFLKLLRKACDLHNNSRRNALASANLLSNYHKTLQNWDFYSKLIYVVIILSKDF